MADDLQRAQLDRALADLEHTLSNVLTISGIARQMEWNTTRLLGHLRTVLGDTRSAIDQLMPLLPEETSQA
jgi:hypothetical protein